MSPRDKNSSQQEHQSTTKGNRMNLKNLIYLTLTVVILIFTLIGALAVLERLGLIGGKSSTQSPSPSIISESPIPTTPSTSTNPSPTPTIPEPSISPTPIITNSPEPIAASSSGVLYIATKCLSTTSGIDNINRMLQSPNNSQISIGKEIVSEIANISYYKQLRQSQPLEFVCGLNSNYKELKLVFGIDDANRYAQPSNKIELQVFLDKKPADTRQVTVGPKQTLVVKVEGINNLGLRVSCTSTCPPLSFLDMGLK
jgi:hypothetical protein